MNNKSDKKAHLEYLKKDFFDIDLLEKIRKFLLFDEYEVLKKYGTWLLMLSSKKILPITDAQSRFLKVVKKEIKPETTFEKLWLKFLFIQENYDKYEKVWKIYNEELNLQEEIELRKLEEYYLYEEMENYFNDHDEQTFQIERNEHSYFYEDYQDDDYPDYDLPDSFGGVPEDNPDYDEVGGDSWGDYYAADWGDDDKEW
ncbi:hypothetical protein MTBBW1_1540013 [Desulfamplus magnetovallimortis]|uniref:Macrodomain Ori protein n=1 Tax=Desulfamplus magnetovallimortis TaxID=1246637 RepID=A0A1W1H8H9_9BACT|nr:DUF413 domain-containing protein [Desulfamplus magnetovallimortis]SLM28787.1 hypothetical protein MTBBW1_1540013 [Desulfamplus magnetovallimortis]